MLKLLNELNQKAEIMAGVLDHSDAMIYVTDPATDEILFISNSMKQHFGIEGDVIGERCYKVLQSGMDKRCDFCPCHKLDSEPNKPVIWEERNSLTKCYYRNIDRYVELSGGRKVHVQYVVDLTDTKQMEYEMTEANNLLSAVNDAATLLLNSDTESFDSAMHESLLLVANAAKVDRMYIWKNYTENGRLYCTQVYEYSVGAEPQQDKEFVLGVAYSEHVPRWEEYLSQNKCINNLIRDVPQGEQDILLPQDIKSILVVPIFIKDLFWGFVGFDDCHSERLFTEKEESILRSGSLLIANALLRNDMMQNIRDTSTQLKSALKEANVASKAKGDFLSTMSHEMRTPMNAIIGMTAIGKKAKDTEQKDAALNKIEDASTHLLGIINDVLDMAKIEANKLETMFLEFDFEKMLHRVISVVSFRIEEKQLNVSINITDGTPRFIMGDEQRLAQVVANLMSNAIKFTPDGGKIEINASLINETDEYRELQIEVADNGIGIDDNQHTKIFQAFEQAESGKNRNYGGTGLGLVISKRIIDLMGGTIWVESSLGKGAKFIFTIKAPRGLKDGANVIEQTNTVVKDAGNHRHKTENCISGEFANMKMLLAEDVKINCEVIMMLLEDTGIIIECAENGQEALDMIEASPNKYDIVFMDMQMPKMDGLEATRRIRALPSQQNKKVPIVAMTANVFKDDVEACLAAGMNEHLGKPLDIDKVLEILRKYLLQEGEKSS